MVFIPDPLPEGFSLLRTALFMPSSNARALEKAKTLACDCVIFDLEDSVAEENRNDAHSNLLSLAKGHDFGNKKTVIRTSALDTNSFEADMKIALQVEPDAILLPKISTAAQIRQAEKSAGDKIGLWAMIETPLSLMNLDEIATASNRLTCLVVGPNDLAKETGAAMDRTVMHPWLMMAVAAARAHGLNVLDGVYNNFRDLDGFTAECALGAKMGFDGKTLIHPDQIEPANAAFGPSHHEIEKAQKIIDAFARPENKEKGAIQIDGEMVERLHLAMAEKLLAVVGML